MHEGDHVKPRACVPEQELVDAVVNLFNKGIRLNAAAWHYIDSTFCHPSAAALGTLLADESNPEREPLLELIFFPDTDQQAALESRIGKIERIEGGENGVLRGLAQFPVKACLFVPGEPDPLEIIVPESALSAFLSRLHIGKKIDFRLQEAVGRFLPASFQVKVRVGLRNSRFAQTEKKVRFLCHFFRETGSEEMDSLKKDFLDRVEFLLAFLDDIPDDTGIFRALADRKRACFRCLNQALRFEEQFRKHNMETLMLQGFRAPHIDKDDMRRKMFMIDRICQAVFGRTESIEGELTAEDAMGAGLIGDAVPSEDLEWRKP